MRITPERIRSLLQEEKIRRYEEMPAIIHELRRAGIYVALAQGVFDIVHAGHVGYLREASRANYKGSVLIVGIENDETVRRNKGIRRPINPVEDRMTVISEFASVRLV